MRLYRVALFALLILLMSGCRPTDGIACSLPCELGLNQSEPLTVQKLADHLVAEGWMKEIPLDETLPYGYGPGRFYNVGRTFTAFPLNGEVETPYGDRLRLQISWIGGINPNFDVIRSAEIQEIYLYDHMTLLESLRMYGIPDFGAVLPFFPDGFIYGQMPCGSSRYTAYYDDGRMRIEAYLPWPLLLKMWSIPVTISYPFDRDFRPERKPFDGLYSMSHDWCTENFG
jgi:hypothetical protein